MKSAFFIAVHTQQKYSPEDYAAGAGELVSLFEQVFNDAVSIKALTKDAPISACSTELEVSHDAGELVGKCVIEIESEQRVPLDKPKLSGTFKALSPWPELKIEKRAVPTA